MSVESEVRVSALPSTNKTVSKQVTMADKTTNDLANAAEGAKKGGAVSALIRDLFRSEARVHVKRIEEKKHLVHEYNVDDKSTNDLANAAEGAKKGGAVSALIRDLFRSEARVHLERIKEPDQTMTSAEPDEDKETTT